MADIANGLSAARASLNAAIDLQMLKAKDAEAGLRLGIAALQDALKDEFDALPSPTPPQLPLVIEPAEQAERFQAFLQADTKLGPLLARLLSEFEQLGLAGVWTAEGSLGLWSGDRCVGSLSPKKKGATLALRIDPAGRPVSFVLGQVLINKEHQLDVIIPIKGETDAAIALALGLLKQVV